MWNNELIFTVLSWFRLAHPPERLAYDSKSDVVFVSQIEEAHNVIAVNMKTGIVMFRMGEGEGYPNNRVGELNSPYGMALDGHGNLLVADEKNKRVTVFNASNGTPIASFHTGFKPHSVFVDQMSGSVIVGGIKTRYVDKNCCEFKPNE